MLKLKKVIATVISIGMGLSSIPITSLSAFAEETKIYTYDDYSIEYKVTNSWGNTDAVDVEITNTGDETIENWMLYFDPNGEIAHIWNAKEATSPSGYTYFKNSGYNSAISAGAQVKFSYFVEDCTDFPNDFIMCQKRAEKETGYSVSVTERESWGNRFNGTITLSNDSDEAIEDWELTFDTNFTITEITSSWAGTMTTLEPYSYKLKGSYTNVIAPHTSMALGFSGVKNGTPEIISSTLTEVVVDENMINNASNYLSSNKKEIVVGSDSNEVYFYYNSLEQNSDILLYENNNPVATFYDDGNYSLHGDDIKGDGIYSIKYNINTESINDSVNVYYAKSSNHKTSNKLSIELIKPFTQQELNNIAYVDNSVNGVVNNTAFQSSEISGRKDTMTNLLEELQDNNKIVDNSIKYDEVNKVLSFKYTRDVIGEILLEDIEDDVDEVNTSNEAAIDSIGNYNLSHLQPLNQVNVAIFNSFENTPFRTDFYEELVARWREYGLNVYYDDVVSVNDLKTGLLNKQAISLSGHGTTSGLYLNEEDEPANIVNDAEYQADLLKNRISRTYLEGGPTYIIHPSFFSYYYVTGSLNGSFIFGNSCQLAGNNNTPDYAFADAFLSASAETFVGYVNSVESNYSRNVMKSYFEALFNGLTSADALDAAALENGEKCFYGAFPTLHGNPNAMLIGTDIKNGNFEGYTQKMVLSPLDWCSTGDARVISKLGQISPYDSRMAFLSTGIGSKQEAYMSGTQGSAMSQVLRVGGYSTLSFNYDVVSEEPEEWVGSRFNDKFEIQILDGNNNILSSEIVETVNTSTWYSLEDVDFDGGDTTVFHTGWDRKIIDLSDYQNQIIQIRFLVYDVGDSIYDTATLLDNIVLS